ncbi:hypothetical protein CK203_083696 [Vitis vinifera]|uniref:DUF674 domain-containing protein n=1 Tax=Vitis vinifera TaxID=29760 RepID=A0A438CYE4_VITVI|nr:hypothetical protein CK203_083696 [Vitis vinifera]
MLLNPRSAHNIHCKNLVLKIDDTEPTKIYMCSKLFCPIKTPNKKAYCLSSIVENSECSCGQAMDKEVFLEYQEGIIDGNGVFMKGTSRMFMITDDLHITPVSMSDSLAMFRKLRLESGNGIEVRTVTIDEEEVLHLLKRSLLSKTPMTDTFLSNEENTENAAPFEPLSRPDHLENRFRKMKVKLLINKSSRRVLCLEAKEDFMNLVLSFLTLPLGSIIRLLRGHSSLGSVDNLYKSVGRSKMEDFFNSTKSKDLLLNPKLPLHFSLNEQLPLKEEDPITPESRRCADCFGKNMVYLYPWGEKLCFMNPKLSGQEARGGGFIKKETLLLINDDLTIQPLSPIHP